MPGKVRVGGEILHFMRFFVDERKGFSGARLCGNVRIRCGFVLVEVDVEGSRLVVGFVQ